MENKFIVYCKNSDDLDNEDLKLIKDIVNDDYNEAYFEVIAEFYLTTELYYKDDTEGYNRRILVLKNLNVDLDDMRKRFEDTILNLNLDT